MRNKILQRDVNLATKANRMIRELLDFHDYVLDPTTDNPDSGAAGKNTKRIEELALDFAADMREYRRKVNPVELRGQRG